MDVIRREGDYAVRIMQVLSAAEGYCPTSRLAAETGVSIDHVRKIMPALSRAGLVQSRRGVNGGFQLARAAGEISLREIVDTVQGPLSMHLCLRKIIECPMAEGCRFRSLLRDWQDDLNRKLESVRLSDLLACSERSLDGRQDPGLETRGS